jgi:hypothetical protein
VPPRPGPATRRGGFDRAPGWQQRARKPADLRAGAAFTFDLPQGVGGTAMGRVERQQLEPLAHGGLAVAPALRSLGGRLVTRHPFADLLPRSRQPAGHGIVSGPQQAQHLPGQGGLGPSILGLGPFGPVLLLLLEGIGRCRRGRPRFRGRRLAAAAAPVRATRSRTAPAARQPARPRARPYQRRRLVTARPASG